MIKNPPCPAASSPPGPGLSGFRSAAVLARGGRGPHLVAPSLEAEAGAQGGQPHSTLWDQGLSSREGCRQSGRLPIERRPSLCQPHSPSCCVPTLPGTPRPGGAPQAQNTQPAAGAVASAPRPAPAEGRSCSRARPPFLYSVGSSSRKRKGRERVGGGGSPSFICSFLHSVQST